MMNIYPTYTVGTMFALGIVQSILVWLALSSAVSKLGSTPVFTTLTRIGFAVFLATWFGLIFSLSESDTFFALTQSGGRERVLLALFTPSVVALLLLGSATVRHILDAIPQHQLIGFQGLRIAGFIFLVFTDMGFVSPTFGVAAGIGDVSVGGFALYAAYSLLRGQTARTIHRDRCQRRRPAGRCGGAHVGSVCRAGRLVRAASRNAHHVRPLICRVPLLGRPHLFAPGSRSRRRGSATPTDARRRVVSRTTDYMDRMMEVQGGSQRKYLPLTRGAAWLFQYFPRLRGQGEGRKVGSCISPWLV